MTDNSGAGESTEPRYPWLPFAAALGVVLVLVIGVFVANALSPAEENTTDGDRVRATVEAYLKARNDNANPPRAQGCSASESMRAFVESSRGRKLEYGRVDEPSVDGDKATATVVVKVDGAEQSAVWDFRRESGKFLTCY